MFQKSWNFFQISEMNGVPVWIEIKKEINNCIEMDESLVQNGPTTATFGLPTVISNVNN